jgi:hypothetical protein
MRGNCRFINTTEALFPPIVGKNTRAAGAMIDRERKEFRLMLKKYTIDYVLLPGNNDRISTHRFGFAA